jgi:hypothetical protein
MANFSRPWHGHSQVGDGPRQRLDRNQRAQFKYLLGTHRRAGRLTANGVDVGHALLKRLSVDGQCDPAVATIAEDAPCSVRTARRAINALKDLGLLIWQRRLVRDGWRTAQTSNAYVLMVPAVENVPVISSRRSGGHTGRETGSKYINYCSPHQKPINEPPSLPDEVRAAQAALAERRRASEEKVAVQTDGQVRNRAGFLIRSKIHFGGSGPRKQLA